MVDARHEPIIDATNQMLWVTTREYWWVPLLLWSVFTHPINGNVQRPGVSSSKHRVIHRVAPVFDLLLSRTTPSSCTRLYFLLGLFVCDWVIQNAVLSCLLAFVCVGCLVRDVRRMLRWKWFHEHLGSSYSRLQVTYILFRGTFVD